MSTGWIRVGDDLVDNLDNDEKEDQPFDHVAVVARRNGIIAQILDDQSDEEEDLPDQVVKRQVSGYMKKRVACEQDWKCAICRGKLDIGFEIDHRKALHRGGTNERDNLWALCSECHKHKTARENERRFQRKRARELRKHRLTQHALKQQSRTRKPDWRYCLMCGECGVLFCSFFEHVCSVRMLRDAQKRQARMRKSFVAAGSLPQESPVSAGMGDEPAGDWQTPNPF